MTTLETDLESMRVITWRRLEEFWDRHPQAQAPLTHWYTVTSGANWRTVQDVRAIFASADAVGRCIVFNIGGNNFRLIAAIHCQREKKDGTWSKGRVYIRDVLTHADYDRGVWKSDCGA